jgi:HlyD family secretion protein
MEWGMVGGRISEISNDILTTNNQQIYFKAICSLDKDYLSLKNGYKTTLKKGMTVNARMLITQRSLYSLLFEKADKWLNPYTNTKNIKN